jgi:hypothetical protein
VNGILARTRFALPIAGAVALFLVLVHVPSLLRWILIAFGIACLVGGFIGVLTHSSHRTTQA